MMLPVAPKDVGRLSDVFAGAMGALVAGKPNLLALPKVKSAVVALVDGLGSQNLREFAGHARNLTRLSTNGKSTVVRCGFPSTTAVSITSFATGLRAGTHGILGYQVADNTGSPFNQLTGWDADHDPVLWQPNETIAGQAKAAGLNVFTVAAREYEDTGFTRVTMRGSEFRGEDDIRGRTRLAGELAKAPGALIYLYFAELDQSAHRFGVGSSEWLSVLEDIDAALGALTGDFGLLVTADHGITNVAQSDHVYLDELDGWTDAVELAVGDPRALFCYGNGELAKRSLASVKSGFAITTFAELKTKGWAEGSFTLGLVPDFVLLAMSSIAFYDRRFAKFQSLRMVGQHGSISDAEMQVPLLRGLKFA